MSIHRARQLRTIIISCNRLRPTTCDFNIEYRISKNRSKSCWSFKRNHRLPCRMARRLDREVAHMSRVSASRHRHQRPEKMKRNRWSIREAHTLPPSWAENLKIHQQRSSQHQFTNHRPQTISTTAHSSLHLAVVTMSRKQRQLQDLELRHHQRQTYRTQCQEYQSAQNCTFRNSDENASERNVKNTTTTEIS